jgi:hypothetical protein
MSRKRVPAARANNKNIDRDLLGQWRLLRKIGVYKTDATPTLGGLTKSRRTTIKRKFMDLQSLGRYEDGEVYRPAHKHEYQKRYAKFDDMGRVTKITIRKYERYEIDTDHFQVLNKKPKKIPGGSLKTSTGFIAPKSANEKLRITKDGKVETVETRAGVLTRFTREPLSGPQDFIRLIDDVKSGRLTFKNNEGLALWNNGQRQIYYGQSAIQKMIQRLARYMAPGGLTRSHGGKGKFDDWSSNSEIAFVKKR